MVKSGNSKYGIVIELSQKVKNIEKILMGNGTEGLMRKMDEASDAIIEMKSYNHLKTWILGSVVAALTAIVSILTTYITLKL